MEIFLPEIFEKKFLFFQQNFMSTYRVFLVQSDFWKTHPDHFQSFFVWLSFPEIGLAHDPKIEN